MSRVIVVRAFNSGDVASCKKLIRDSIMSSLGTTFRRMLFSEFAFQTIIVLFAIMFIFIGTSLISCFLVIPLVALMYVGIICLIFSRKIKEINIEMDNIFRKYMLNAGYFWVAEAFKFSAEHPEEVDYIIRTEQFCEADVQMSYPQDKQIVGMIGLCKSDASEKSARIKMLYVHRQYQKKRSIAERLVKTAVQFASNAGYSCVDMVASEYREEHRQLCLRERFELTKMYHQNILPLSYFSKLMYELTYEIRLNDQNSHYQKGILDVSSG